MPTRSKSGELPEPLYRFIGCEGSSQTLEPLLSVRIHFLLTKQFF